MAKLTHTISNTIASFRSSDKANITNLKCHFLPIQEGSGTPSPSNVRNITGWNNLLIYHSRKNLFDINTLNITDGTYTITVLNGIASGTTQSFLKLTAPAVNKLLYPTFPIDNSKALTFKITAYTDNNLNLDTRGMCLCIKCIEQSVQYIWFNNTDITPTTKTLTIPVGTILEYFYISYSNGYANKWYITEFQIEYADEATEYETYQCNSYPITFPNNNTIYGGYIDLVSGELVQTKYAIDPLDGTFNLNGNLTDVYSVYVWSNIQETYKPVAHTAISNRFYRTGTGSSIGSIDNYTSIYFGLPKNELETVDLAGAKKWFENHPTLVVYDLETPIVYLLTSLLLKTLIGQNNIWSNTNGNTEITYEFTDRLLKKSFSLYNPEFIPPAYEKCNYLLSDGRNTRVDTGVPGNNETLQIHCEFMPIEYSASYLYIFGNYKTESANKCWRVIFLANTSGSYNTSLYATPGNGAPSGSGVGVTTTMNPLNSGETLPNKYITVDMSYGRCTMTGTKTHTITTSTKTVDDNSLNIAISSASPTAAGHGGNHIRFYNFRIRSHGALIRNYIPVIRRSDRLAGFYDTVNGTFNPSIGGKEFIAGFNGSELTLPDGYTRISRLILNGNTNNTDVSYINLRRKFDSTHRYKFIVNFSNNDNGIRNFYFFGAREQTSYIPKNTSFAYTSDYHFVFYGINDGFVDNNSYGTSIDLTNTYSEDQEIELKCINGLLTCTNSEGILRAVPNGGMARETFLSETNVMLGGVAVQGYILPYYTFRTGSSIKLYEEYDEHDILITKFVPCIRNSDNVAGMYDIITNTFWPSDNSDYPFIAGYE